MLGIVFEAWRRRRSADAIYFTGAESFAGNLKDLLIYMVCFKQLGRMVIHLHGGGGMREIMLSPWHPLRVPNEFFVRRLGGAIVLGARHVDIYGNALPPEKIHVVPNFAEEYLFADDDCVDRKFRNPKPLRILFLSNLLPGKGHQELVDAFLALSEHARNSILLDIAGGFDSERAKQAFLGRIEGVAQIRYHGTVSGDRKKQLFHEAHVFCLPTYYPYEGQPISILEAYASGCAVITTDHSGIRDVFTPGENGFEVATRSSAEVGAAIEAAAADTDRLHRIAKTNLRAAREKFRVATYGASLVRIVESVSRRC